MKESKSFLQNPTNHFFLFSNKFAIIITLIFFFSLLYVGFFHHTIWSEQDGIYYYYNGKEFFAENSSNIQIIGAPFGTPVIYSVLSGIFGMPFEVAKSISLISGTAIVLFSYLITKNIFGPKIAILTQSLIAINPKFQSLSFSALNELLPIAFIVSSLYFLTKDELKNSHFIFIGILLGFSFMIRYQAIFIVIGVIIFLFLRKGTLKFNFAHSGILILAFFVTASPVLLFNYYTYGDPIESDTSFYLLSLFKFQTPEWRESIENMNSEGLSSIILNDPNLFLKNYLFNLFSHNPNKLFNFGTLDNLSIVPIIPVVGFITIVMGFLHMIQVSKNKQSVISLIVLGLSLLFVLSFGDLFHHYFAIFFIPLLVLGFLHIKQIKPNFLPLLVLSVVIFFSLSIIPAYRSYHFLFLLLPFSILNSIFIIDFLPKIIQQKFLKVKNS